MSARIRIVHERKHMGTGIFSEAEAGHRAERVTERGADQIRVEQRRRAGINRRRQRCNDDGDEDDDDDDATTMMKCFMYGTI